MIMLIVNNINKMKDLSVNNFPKINTINNIMEKNSIKIHHIISHNKIMRIKWLIAPNSQLQETLRVNNLMKTILHNNSSHL